jgi:heme/copper-type cytochrome/quinol oxidase subunit 2
MVEILVLAILLSVLAVHYWQPRISLPTESIPQYVRGSDSFLNMAFFMLATVIVGVFLVVAVLVLQIAVRERPEEHGLYGDR